MQGRRCCHAGEVLERPRAFCSCGAALLLAWGALAMASWPSECTLSKKSGFSNLLDGFSLKTLTSLLPVTRRPPRPTCAQLR